MIATMADTTAYYYRRLPYTRRVEAIRYQAWIEELPSISIDGESPEDALRQLEGIFDKCIKTMIEAGESIPEPKLWPKGMFGSEASVDLRELIQQVEAHQPELEPDEPEVRVTPLRRGRRPWQMAPWYSEETSGGLTLISVTR